MAAGTDPIFTKTPKASAVVLGGFDASFTSPSTSQTLWTPGTDGSKVEEITVQGLATLVAGLVNIWYHDGTNFRLFDQFQLTATPTASTTAVAYRLPRSYANLLVPSGSTLKVSHTVTGNDTSKLCVVAIGGDY